MKVQKLFMLLTVLLSALLPSSSTDVATIKQWLAASHPLSLQCLRPKQEDTLPMSSLVGACKCDNTGDTSKPPTSGRQCLHLNHTSANP